MNILFISYWGINEGLTQSTVIPNIKILLQNRSIYKVILITIEREEIPKPVYISDKTEHIPILSKSNSIPYLGNILDFITIPRTINKLCAVFKINKIIARGAPGGALAYMISKRNDIPFFVESFEPHSDYMKESGVWKKWSLKYLFQKRWEKKQCQTASGIMTVSEGYTKLLTNRLHREIKIRTVPCAVNMADFKYNLTDRIKIRKDLNLKDDQIVGIYVGKFGGLYIDLDEINKLRPLFEYFENLNLIILTSNPVHEVRTAFDPIIKSKENIFIKNISYNEVPKFLSAADFGLSLNKRFQSGRFLSPIKHGEYWANGLPVLMTDGIGDESSFLEEEKGGVLFNEHNLMSSLNKLQRILDDPNHRKKIPELARKYRSFDKVKQAYERMIISSEE